jgi:hypothetical protein
MDRVKVEQVILCSKERRGDGKSYKSPIRIVHQVFSFEGDLIAENDPCEYSIEILASVIDDAINYSKQGMNNEEVTKLIFKERSIK